jgi:hypothetical protein
LETLLKENRDNACKKVERSVAATLDRIGRDLFRIIHAQQAHFAVTDTLIKANKNAIDPFAEASGRSSHIASSAGERGYHRFVKSAGQNMVGDSRAAMCNLMAPDEG